MLKTFTNCFFLLHDRNHSHLKENLLLNDIRRVKVIPPEGLKIVTWHDVLQFITRLLFTYSCESPLVCHVCVDTYIVLLLDLQFNMYLFLKNASNFKISKGGGREEGKSESIFL